MTWLEVEYPDVSAQGTGQQGQWIASEMFCVIYQIEDPYL